MSDSHEPKTIPNLTGIPETMLWTLYNRAVEAKRADRVFDDPESIRIFDSLDYDFPRSFGDPDAAHALRAKYSDDLLKDWMRRHPGGTVISLGEGLESQALRVDDGKVRWVSVDLPAAIDIRERFIAETDRRQHLRLSALDPAWMDAVESDQPVFIVAQGIFMYFAKVEVHQLISTMVERFPGMELFFDSIPPWFSKKTVKGMNRTPHFRLPPMPWGIDLRHVETFLQTCGSAEEVRIIRYALPRGPLRWISTAVSILPVLRHHWPAMTYAKFAS